MMNQSGRQDGYRKKIGAKKTPEKKFTGKKIPKITTSLAEVGEKK